MSLGAVFFSEFLGTLVLILLGCGVVANVALTKTKGFNGGFLLVNFGWGLAVFAGVYMSFASGAHLNPAVTIGLAVAGNKEFVPGIPVDAASIGIYILAQLLGAINHPDFVEKLNLIAYPRMRAGREIRHAHGGVVVFKAQNLGFGVVDKHRSETLR